MSSTVNNTLPVAVTKGGNPPSQGQISTSPSGYTMALLYKAQRDAASNEEKQQAYFAQAEQDQAKQMGNLGGDPGKGIIALVSSTIAQAGEDTAQGLVNSATAELCGAGVNTMVTAGSLGAQGSKSFSGEDSVSGLEKQMKTTQTNGKILDGKPNDMGVGANRPINEDEVKLNNRMDEMAAKGPQGNSELDKQAAGALKNRPEELQRARDAHKATIDELSRKLQQRNTEIQQLAQGSQMITGIVNQGSQAAGTLAKAPKDVDAAHQQATTEVDRQLEQTTSSTQNSLKDEGKAQRQNALSSAQGIGQLAQTQTRMS